MKIKAFLKFLFLFQLSVCVDADVCIIDLLKGPSVQCYSVISKAVLWQLWENRKAPWDKDEGQKDHRHCQHRGSIHYKVDIYCLSNEAFVVMVTVTPALNKQQSPTFQSDVLLTHTTITWLPLFSFNNYCCQERVSGPKLNFFLFFINLL